MTGCHDKNAQRWSDLAPVNLFIPQLVNTNVEGPSQLRTDMSTELRGGLEEYAREVEVGDTRGFFGIT